MVNENDINLEKFDQIGIVVKDIEKSAKIYRELFNFKGSCNIVEQKASVICRGKEGTYKMKKIMDFFGGKQLEIVEIVEAIGPNLYSEFLNEDRQGLHHLGIYMKDSNKIIEYFKNNYNIDVIQTGKIGKLTFRYLDTINPLGYFVELIEF
jgi:catechol 2,3-dioxygenase-like lactoylglutathione lyase family enzyme